jgi:predicted PurR-regulated permease PerM
MEQQSTLRDTVLTIAGIFLILFALRSAQDLVIPFLLSIFISIVITVPISWLKRLGVSTPLAVGIVILATFFLEMGAGLLLGKSASQFNQAMPEYHSRIAGIMDSINGWMSKHDIDWSDSGLSETLNPNVVLSYANSFMTGLGSVLSNVLLIMFTVLFMLVEIRNLPLKLQAVDDLNGGALLEKCTSILESTKQYISMKTLTSLVTGVLVTIGLTMVGLDFAPLWGVLAFALNFIPTIGSVLAAAPAVLLSFLQFGFSETFIVIGIYLLVNIAVGTVLEPTVMGQKVGLSTLAVFLSLIFWGWLLGPAGMLLSVPLTMVIKDAAATNKQTLWLAVLLGPAPLPPKDDEK